MTLPGSKMNRRWWRWSFMLYAAATTSVGAALFVRASYISGGRTLSFGRALLWQASIFFAWIPLALLIARIGRRWRLRGDTWFAPLPAYMIASVPVILLHAAWAASATWLLRPARDGGALAFADFFGAFARERIPVGILTYSAIVGVLYAAEYYGRYVEREAVAARLEEQLATAQLRALKAQLHPHFLFNTLHTIAVLIGRDPEAARRMTILLGALLRATLARAAAHEVPLADELALLRDYLAIEQIRFRDRLTVGYDIDPAALGCLVPDLILQPLVENALKHGIAPRPAPGSLTIRARLRDDALLCMEVIDDGIGLPPSWRDDAAGIGLATTRARLAEMYGANHSFTIEPNAPRGVAARIRVPATCAPTTKELTSD